MNKAKQASSTTTSNRTQYEEPMIVKAKSYSDEVTGPSRIKESVSIMRLYQDIELEHIGNIEYLVNKIGLNRKDASDSIEKAETVEESLAGYLESHNRSQSNLNNRLYNIMSHLISLVGSD